MKFFKIALASCASVFLATSLSACASQGKDANTLTVAASPAPHAKILTEFAAPKMEEKGFKLEVKEYTDYLLPNSDTTSGAVDANYFQHINYLNNYNEENGTDLVNAGNIHYEPFGLFAGKSNDLNNIAKGATVAVPNDPTNEGRALLLLQDLGLIKLSDESGITATPKDIVENPHELKILELEAAALPRTLSDNDFAIINGNYAIEAGLKVEDALALEDSSSSIIQEEYANVICTTSDKQDNEAVKALVEILQSDECADYLASTFGSSVLPVK